MVSYNVISTILVMKYAHICSAYRFRSREMRGILKSVDLEAKKGIGMKRLFCKSMVALVLVLLSVTLLSVCGLAASVTEAQSEGGQSGSSTEATRCSDGWR